MTTIDQIKSHCPLPEYIEQRTRQQWKEIGAWKDISPCPMCGGNDCFRLSPSGTVFCFQCYSFVGDCIHFRMLFDRLSYKEAVELFVKDLNLKKFDRKEIEWVSLRELACEYLREVLFTCGTKYQFQDKSLSPLMYLTDVRKHSIEALLNFRVGFNDGSLEAHLQKHFSADVVKASGLNIISAGLFTYPFAVNGEIKYFRLKDPNKIKKFQMPLTSRSKNAVWFNQDILCNSKEIWAVEGEDDVLSLWDAGKNAVACCGPLQVNQVRYLQKYNFDAVYIAFDGDPAGRLDFETFVRAWQGVNIFAVKIPDGQDIDDLLRNSEDVKQTIDELVVASVIPSPEIRSKIRERIDGYYIFKGDSEWKISNWTLTLNAIIYSDSNETSTWKGTLKTETGERTVYIPVACFSQPDRLKEFLLNQGRILFFRGNSNDLVDLIQYFSLVGQPKKVIESEYIGETPHGFIAENIFVSNQGELRPLVNGYLDIDNNTSVRIVPLVKKGGQHSELPYFNLTEPLGGIQAYKKQIYDLLVKNRNLKVLLAIGWLKAVFWAKKFYAQRRFFPILCIHGKTRSGKSLFSSWLMSMAGLHDCNPEMLSDRGTTEVGLARKMAYYSSLPVFADDYRANEVGAKFHAYFNAVFDRSSATKGLREEFGVRRVLTRGCLLLAGEHVPPDNALQSRMICIELTRGERNDEYYPEIRKHEGNLSILGFDWLKHAERDWTKFFDHYERLEKTLIKTLDDPRQCACLCVAIASMLTENYCKEKDLVDFAIKLTKQEQSEQRAEELIARLWEALDILHRKNQTDEQEIYHDKYINELMIHLPSLVAKIRGSQFTRHYVFPNNREIAKLLKQEPYIVAFKNVRVVDKVSGRWVVNLADAPEVLKNCFGQVESESEVGGEGGEPL